MWHFTEAADWFSKQSNQSEQILDEWVEDTNYNTGAILAASATKAFITFGSGFVDLLRLGDGVKEGSLNGYGQDALRLVAVFPVGKVTSMVKSVKGVAAAKLVADTGGPNCFWVASTQALRQIGHKFNGKLFVSLEDIAQALKMPAKSPWLIPNLATGLAYLQRMGAKVGTVKQVSNVGDVSKMVPKDGSIVMVSVQFVSKFDNQLKGHAIYAYRNFLGQVRFIDRGLKASKMIHKDLEVLADIYHAKSGLKPIQAAVVHNLYAKTTVAHEFPRLVIPVLGVMAEER